MPLKDLPCLIGLKQLWREELFKKENEYFSGNYVEIADKTSALLNKEDHLLMIFMEIIYYRFSLVPPPSLKLLLEKFSNIQCKPF